MDSQFKNIDDATKRIRERIANACNRAGRSESGVRLIGATKGVDIERIRYAARCGLTDFGENYIQEAKGKIEALNPPAPPFPRTESLRDRHKGGQGGLGILEKVEKEGFNGGEVCWHMIGYIQTNKVKYIPKLFDYVHSVDRWEILEMLDGYGKDLKVLFELNLANETSKHGTEEDNLRRMLEKVSQLKHITPVGLMTMPPLVENPEEVRGIFRRLKEILQSVNLEFAFHMTELSMGMSSDFEVAVEEGATMVRIGTAIFGERI